MKIIIFLVLLLNCQFITSQSEADYDNVVKTVIEVMNSKDGVKLFDQFSSDLQASMPLDQLNSLISEKIEELGVGSEYDFMDEDENGKRYLVQTANDSFILVINLSPEIELTRFQIE